MNLYYAITRHLYNTPGVGVLAYDAYQGAEALAYDPFIRLYGIRERVGDITRPKIQTLGDIELPRNALYHYVPALPGEIGPGNQAGAFLYQQKGRINLFFDWDYSVVADPGGMRIKPRDKLLIEAQYFKTHFRFTRIRSLAPYFTKTNELIVVNHAPAFNGVNYLRQTPSLPYARFCNETTTIIDSINHLADISDRHQFWAIPLPPRFVKMADLKYASRFRADFFKEDGTFTKVPPDILRKFASGNTWWVLELYQFLQAPPSANTIQTSLFSRLTEKARKQCNLVFVWQGQCLIVNVQVLLALMNYRVDAESPEALSTRRNHFKRFYLNLIGLVSQAPITTLLQEDKAQDDSQDDDNDARPVEGDTSPTLNLNKAEGREVAPVDPPAVIDLDSEADDEQVVDFTQLDMLEPAQHAEAEATPQPPATPSADDLRSTEGDVLDDDALDRLIEADTLISAQDTYAPDSAIIRALDQRAKEGNLSQREKQFYLNAAETWKELDIDGIPLEKLIDIQPEDMVIDDVSLAKDHPTLTDKSALKSRAWVARVGYVKKLMQRNIAEMIVYLQNAQVCVTDVKKKPVTTATSKYDLWTVETLTLEGNKKTLHFRLPRIDSNGEFLINGVKSYMQFQRMEKPVRKVTELAVQLTSYYDKGRIRVERSKKVVDDYARWLQTRLIQASQTRPGISVKLGKTEYRPKNASLYYSMLSARFTEIQLGNITLNMDTPALLEQHPKAKKWCDENQWCVGEADGRFLVLDKSGMLSWQGNTLAETEDIDYLETLAGLPIEKAPLPVATININGYKFPAVVVLAYWMGLKGLLEAIGADYRVVEGTQRVKLAPDEYLVSFADTRLIFQRRHELTTLIVSGLLKFPRLSEFGMSHLEDPNIWFSLVGDERIKPTHFKEMTQLYNMFIDPITRRLLVQDGYPTSMEKLCIAAIKLLLSRYSPSEVEITEQRFVGYERFAGHVYREFSKAARLYRNKPNNGKRTFDLNPEAVMLQIITDSSVQAVEEVNPIHQIKQQEEVTFGGTLGRAEQAMVRRTRGMQSNYVGIISEAGKDSGKVGFVSYLSSDPKLVDYYGNINADLPATKAGTGSVTLNTLYGGTRDDAKRSLFASVQRSQVMAVVNYTSSPMRTTYNTMLGQRTGEPYTSIAKQDGKVIEVSHYGIKVQYQDGSTDQFPLGVTIGKAAGEYHKHSKVTDMNVGDTFEATDVLAWDDLFFERDLYNPKRVILKMSMLARIALSEDPTTFEDSVSITKEFAEISSVPFIKINTANIYDDEIIRLYVKVGDSVEYDQVMVDVENPTTVLGDDDAEFAGLERFGVKQLKANQTGKVLDISLLYNGDITDFHPDTQKVLKQFNAIRAKKASYQEDEAKDGNVGGNTHVTKTDILPGSVQMNIYIEEILSSTTSDKLIAGNQMKATVGYIYPRTVKTEDGRPVHVISSMESLLARMVLSMRDKLVCHETNNVYTHRLIERIEGQTTWKI